MIKTITAWAIIMSVLATAIPANAYDYPTQDAQTYILEKTVAHNIVFMGTTHKQSAILGFIADLLPRIHTTGITHLALEVASDQQERIDRYLDSGVGLADIELHQAIDCPRYRQLFAILKDLDPSRRPKVLAIDLPPHRYNGSVGRDAYMAEALDRTLQSHSNSKVLAILGSFHVLRQLQWKRRVINGHEAIRTLLAQRHPGLRMFSMVHILSDKDAKCDFGLRLGPVEHTVALDVDPGFDDWHLGLTASLAIQPAPIRKIIDGLILH